RFACSCAVRCAVFIFFFSSRRRHTRLVSDWSSDVCSSDLVRSRAASISVAMFAMHQGINFLIADMATEIEAARLLTWQAAWLLDRGERAPLPSSFAKRFSADTAMKVTTDAVQAFGGYGSLKEYPLANLIPSAHHLP